MVSDFLRWGPDTGSLVDVAYAAIKEKLVLLHIGPAEPLNETALAQELGVGRTPLREALKRLEQDFLVVSYPRRGTFSTHVSIAELAEITELRLALEPVAAANAALRATPQQRERLEHLSNLVQQMTAAKNVVDKRSTDDLLRLDIAVHHGVYEACGNSHMEDVLKRYDYLATRIWSLAAHLVPDLKGSISEHQQMLHAVISAQDEQASLLTAVHIKNFEESIRNVL